MRSVTKSHFALQWWPPPLDFMRNDKRNESPPRTPQEWHAMLRLAPPSLQLKRFQKKPSEMLPDAPETQAWGCFFWDVHPGTWACFWLPSLSSCLLFGFLDSTEPFEMPKFNLIWNINGRDLWHLTFKGSIYTITHTNKASPIARGSCVYFPIYPSLPANRSNFRKLFLLRLHSSSSSWDKLCLVSVFKTFAMRFRSCCFCVFFF